MHTRSPDTLLNEAARVLAEVRERIWDGGSLPVPIEAIAESHFGLLIRDVDGIAAALAEREIRAPESGEKSSSALIPELAEIWVDAEESHRSPRRRRYAIAHEIGHWELHRGPDPALCREAAVAPAETVTSIEGRGPESFTWTANPGEPGIEWEANVFGGALLLPPWLVREVWDQTHSVEALADAFDCSLAAVEGRWQQHYWLVEPGAGSL
jgi:hypothetical protein